MIVRGMKWCGMAVCILVMACGCETVETTRLREEQQRLNTIIINYEKENRDLMAQVEQVQVDQRKLELALDAKDRQIDVMRRGMMNLRSTVKLESKVQHQLEILAERLGGTLVENRLLLPSDFFFGSGEFSLRPQAKSAIKEMAEILKDEKLTLMIVGHTDNDPVKHAKRKGIKDNRHLALMRSYAVLDEMRDNGYPEDLMYPTGWGALKPVAGNDSNAGKARNRRVEIYIDPNASGLFSNVAITEVAPVAPVVGGEDVGGPVEVTGSN